MNLPNGHLLQNGKYRLTHVVGQGGFGITYKGVWFTEVKGSLGTVKTDVPIAIKEYFFKDYCYREDDSFAVKVHSETGKNLFDKFKEKLIREARILSDVHHPNIVNVLEVFEENNTAYIAMEYISGLSLKEMMEREGILPENKILKYVHQIGEALQFVHDNSILHLDIKPSNILIDRRDNARLIDFGVSKRYDIEQQETSTTMLTLSKGFASIEQYDNEGTQNFSPYPDVYSLGATMYNLLTGKIPTESILRATRPLAKPSELNPEISQKTEAVIMKAMEVVPADRYHSVKEMMDALDKPSVESFKEQEEHSAPYFSDGGDTTLLYPLGNSKLPVGDENEQTLLNYPEETPVVTKKKKKGLYTVILLIAFAVVASAVSFVFYHSNKTDSLAVNDTQVTDGTNRDNPQPETDNQLITDVADEENTETNEAPVVTDMPSTHPDPEETNSSSVPQERETESAATVRRENPIPTTTDNIIPEITTPSRPNREELDATFNSLIASGKEKMLNNDNRGARADFMKAGEISFTDELLNLLKDVDKNIISERKALYEEKMPFGTLTIVSKKSTRLWGAIDDEGNEVIPCNYLVVENAGEGRRAFVREDNLFDIYNSNGTLINKGVANYN